MKTPLANFGVKIEVPSITRKELLREVREHKLVLVRGLPAFARDELLSFAAVDPARDLIHWSFGPVMEMQADPATENYLFSREAVPFHWDGAFHEVPRFLLFHCVEAPDPAMGGETTFCDAEAIAARASPYERARWAETTLRYDTEKKSHYGGSFSTRMLERHPDKGTPILRYAEPVDSALNPVQLTVEGETPGFREEMRAQLYHPDFFYAHRWETNDLLIADNFSLLHGRNAFSDSSPRHLRRIQLR